MKWILLLVLATFTTSSADSWAVVQPGRMVLLRHAIAPGGGDPAGFALDDCRTQRNLDQAGRDQAKRIGVAFRTRRIDVRLVLSSQWCRTKETAELAFPGLMREEPAFNSFFGVPEREASQTRAALNVLRQWDKTGVLVVVTHQVNIAALTNISPASGEGIVVRLNNQNLEVMGRIQP